MRHLCYLIRMIARFWCGRKEQSDGIARNERPGIEDIRRCQKSLENQGFFTIERQRGRQNFYFLKKFLQYSKFAFQTIHPVYSTRVQFFFY